MKLNYTLDENNYIIGYRTFPLNENEPILDIDKNDIFIGVSQVIDGKFYSNKEQYEAQQAENAIKASYTREMREIISWLGAHDYMVNKHLLGEYTDTDER